MISYNIPQFLQQFLSNPVMKMNLTLADLLHMMIAHCCACNCVAVAPLHSSVCCGATIASPAAASPLLTSVTSSAVAVRGCRRHCALAISARYTYLLPDGPVRRALCLCSRVGHQSPYSQVIKDTCAIIHGEFVACFFLCHCPRVPLLR